jgi:hypothetical protein
MNSNPETLYGVGFLDDLHNYFPALLYDSSSFENVQDVLAYIQRQTRGRFDLFSYGQREYLSTHPPPQPSPETVYRRVVRTSFAGVPTAGLPPLSTLRRSPAPLNPNDTSILSSLNVNIPTVAPIMPNNEEEEEEETEVTVNLNQTDMNLANALLALLHLPAAPLTRNYLGGRTMDQFLQPVVVRPTAEQIAANTTVGNLVSDTDHSCAICQDQLMSDQEGRKLNACGHWFHKTCIDTWLGTNVHCPVCRHDIREPAQEQS